MHLYRRRANADAAPGSIAIGAVKPNLLRVIDNGIGLLTEISYATTTDFYLAAQEGGNPWSTRLPFPSQVVAQIKQTYGLNLDSLPPESAIQEVLAHDAIRSVIVVELPQSGQLPTWMA